MHRFIEISSHYSEHSLYTFRDTSMLCIGVRHFTEIWSISIKYSIIYWDLASLYKLSRRDWICLRKNRKVDEIQVNNFYVRPEKWKF